MFDVLPLSRLQDKKNPCRTMPIQVEWIFHHYEVVSTLMKKQWKRIERDSGESGKRVKAVFLGIVIKNVQKKL